MFTGSSCCSALFNHSQCYCFWNSFIFQTWSNQKFGNSPVWQECRLCSRSKKVILSFLQSGLNNIWQNTMKGTRLIIFMARYYICEFGSCSLFQLFHLSTRDRIASISLCLDSTIRFFNPCPYLDILLWAKEIKWKKLKVLTEGSTLPSFAYVLAHCNAANKIFAVDL